MTVPACIAAMRAILPRLLKNNPGAAASIARAIIHLERIMELSEKK
jgi:hypothetical protein